ncbi:MAG: hypothetical protein HYY06_29355, partial [Deltaproteobacteria bacterium]|nr:hypothetical protein [Deltaproteobacteria bacterium]
MCEQGGGVPDPQDGVCYCRTDPDLGIFSEPADLLAPQAGELTESSDARSVTHEDVYDALALACYLELQAEGGCPFFDPRNPPAIPSVGSIGDLKNVEHFVDCAARSIAHSAGRAVLSNVPRVVADAVAARRLLQPYPEYRGEHLDALVALQTDLEQVGSLATSIQYQLQEASLATAAARQSLLIEQAERELRELQASAALLARASAAIASAYMTFGASMAGLVEGYVLDQEIQALQTEIGAIAHGQILTQYVGQIGDVLEKLSDLDSELRETYYRLNADLDRIESVQNRALSAAARAAFGDRDESGRLFPVTTVMRRRYNTLRIRYERARDRARKMAFVARRAIEQRFGVELESLNRDLTLIEAPATWARDVCTFEGIDYQRIREAQVPNPDETPVDELVPENYVDGYLGDYVQKLRLFVESYPFDFPFQDGEDLAVVSIRDDLYQTKVECEVVVPNLLASSEAIAGDPGGEVSWQLGGCPEAEGVTEACLAVASSPHPEIQGRGVSRLTDLGDALTGVVQQEVVVDAAPATLLLSWQDSFRTPGQEGVDDLGVYDPVQYRVTIERVGGGEGEIESRQFKLKIDSWRLKTLALSIREPGTIRVSIDQSAYPGERGDLWLSELQLEVLDRDRALLGDDAPPSIYMPTTRSGVSV